MIRSAFPAGLVDALDVASPKVEHDQDGRNPPKTCPGGMCETQMIQVGSFVQQVGQVLACADHADGAGEDVIEDER